MPEERSQLSTTSIRAVDVTEILAEIDKRHSLRTSRKMGARFKPFLESVQQFSAIIDTFIQSDPTAAALVWGGVKFVILLFILLSLAIIMLI